MSINLNLNNGNVTWKYQDRTYSCTAEKAFEYGGYIYIEALNDSNEICHLVTDLKGTPVLRFTNDTLTMYINSGEGNDFPLKGVQASFLRGDDIFIMLTNELLVFTRGTENFSRITPPAGYQFNCFEYTDTLTVVCTGDSDMRFVYDSKTNSWTKLSAEY